MKLASKSYSLVVDDLYTQETRQMLTIFIAVMATILNRCSAVISILSQQKCWKLCIGAFALPTRWLCTAAVVWPLHLVRCHEVLTMWQTTTLNPSLTVLSSQPHLSNEDTEAMRGYIIWTLRLRTCSRAWFLTLMGGLLSSVLNELLWQNWPAGKL